MEWMLIFALWSFGISFTSIEYWYVGAFIFGTMSALIAFSLLVDEFRFQLEKIRYASEPGAIIDDDGVRINGDGGPFLLTWANLGEFFVSRFEEKPVLQLLSSDDLHLKGYARLSSYTWMRIDHLDIEPGRFVRLIRSHPCCTAAEPSKLEVMYAL